MDSQTETFKNAPPATRSVRDSTIVRFLVVAGVVALLVFGFLWVRLHFHHDGGDPDGKIMATLRRIDVAVPPGALAFRQENSPRWDSCDIGEGSGWSGVGYEVRFTSDRAESDIAARADAVLGQRGWAPLLESGGVVSRWTRAVPSGTARVVLDHRADGGWSLLAFAPPEGVRARCG
jgi:hypothetical protein